MRRNALPAVIVVVALLAAGTAGAALTLGGTGTADAADANGSTTPGKTIAVSAEGTASAAPDEAIVEVAVVAEGDDPAAIRDRLASGAADLRAALRDANVPADQVETTEYRIDQAPRYPEKTETEPAYRGVHAFRIELPDTDRAGPVVDAAAGTGAEVRSVSFTLSKGSEADLRDAALRDAMNGARRQAGTIADAGDLRVVGVDSVDATAGSVRPVRYEATAVAAGGSGGTSIEGGDVTVTANVRVVYNATG
ncbi:MAG: SIMPL domain-containing protein [Haloarculaceae archaeon]